MKRIILISIILLAAQSAPRLEAQADWLDALLPANHLLEKLPFVDENGQPVPGGLFTFEDLNGDGRKDLILAHREAVAADKLDQPHAQTLIVCFFEPVKKVYAKVLDDEGGPLKWVRIVTDEKSSRRFLVLEREDWQAEHSVRAYTASSQGRMDKVLETQSPFSFASVTLRGGKVEVLYSAKQPPAAPGKADVVFAWNETVKQFVDSKGISFAKIAMVAAPTPTMIVVASAGKAKPEQAAVVSENAGTAPKETGLGAPAVPDDMAPPSALPELGLEPTVEVTANVPAEEKAPAKPKAVARPKAKKAAPKKAKPAPAAKPAEPEASTAAAPEAEMAAPSSGPSGSSGQAAKPEPAGEEPVAPAPAAKAAPAVSSTGSAGSPQGGATRPSGQAGKRGWWDQPFSASTAYAKLKDEMIPRRVKNNQLTPLGQEAKAFFDQLNASGIKGEEYSSYRAGYLTTVASELFSGGDAERGKYYLDLVLKYRPDFQDALTLKAKVSGGATTP